MRVASWQVCARFNLSDLVIQMNIYVEILQIINNKMR